MARTADELGGFDSRARMSSAEARFPAANTACMISRSRRERASSEGRGGMLQTQLIDTFVACQWVRGARLSPRGAGGRRGSRCGCSLSLAVRVLAVARGAGARLRLAVRGTRLRLVGAGHSASPRGCGCSGGLALARGYEPQTDAFWSTA